MDHIPARIVEEGSWKNRKEMISCPYPPGQLKISKRACKKRYAPGRRPK